MKTFPCSGGEVESTFKREFCLTQTVSSVLCMYLGLGDAGVSVQLAVVSVGSAVTATHPALCRVTPLQRKRRGNRSRFMTAQRGSFHGMAHTTFDKFPLNLLWIKIEFMYLWMYCLSMFEQIYKYIYKYTALKYFFLLSYYCSFLYVILLFFFLPM